MDCRAMNRAGEYGQNSRKNGGRQADAPKVKHFAPALLCRLEKDEKKSPFLNGWQPED